MVNACLANALIVTLLVICCLMLMWTVFKIICRIRFNIKIKQHDEKNNKERVWNNFEEIYTTLGDTRSRLFVLESNFENLNKKETKKNVKKKKRN